MPIGWEQLSRDSPAELKNHEPQLTVFRLVPSWSDREFAGVFIYFFSFNVKKKKKKRKIKLHKSAETIMNWDTTNDWAALILIMCCG